MWVNIDFGGWKSKFKGVSEILWEEFAGKINIEWITTGKCTNYAETIEGIWKTCSKDY